MDDSLIHFENLDSSHNAGYIDVNESDLEFSDSDEEKSDHPTEKINPTSSSEEDEVTLNVNSTNVIRNDKKRTMQDMSEQFESDMNQELNGIMNNLGYSDQTIQSMSDTNNNQNKISESNSNNNASFKYYDSINYSDDDDKSVDDTDTPDKKNNSSHFRENILSNDELLYDPLADERDQLWVDRQRRANRCIEENNFSNSAKSNKVEETMTQTDSLINCSLEISQSNNKDLSLDVTEDNEQMEKHSEMLQTAETHKEISHRDDLRLKQYTAKEKIRSDAILSCPGCMTTLCIDCQQHVCYANQYRAMFVLNCLIMKEQILKYKNKPKSKRKSKTKQTTNETELVQTEQFEDVSVKSTYDEYNAVQCASCNTEVAVYDKEEIFHFYNVLPSQS